MQTKVIINSNNTHKKIYKSDAIKTNLQQQIATADGILLQPQSAIKKPQIIQSTLMIEKIIIETSQMENYGENIVILGDCIIPKFLRN